MWTKCAGCRDDGPPPFSFAMAFQPSVDMGTGSVWGYEARVRGPNGESAYSILYQVSEDTRYRFDQAERVMAIETAGSLYDFMPNAVYWTRACIHKSLAAATSSLGQATPIVPREWTAASMGTSGSDIKAGLANR